MRTLAPMMIGLLAAAALGGCTLTGGRATPIHSTIDPHFDALWDATTEVLGVYRFKIDRADRRGGVITTFPLVGRHWFEFWRKDATTNRDILEGTLHNDSREVTVNIIRIPSTELAPQNYDVGVIVQTKRSNRRTQQITSTSEAYDMFTGAIDRDYEDDEEDGPLFAKLGRDKELEEVLRTRIKLRADRKLRKARR